MNVGRPWNGVYSTTKPLMPLGNGRFLGADHQDPESPCTANPLSLDCDQPGLLEAQLENLPSIGPLLEDSGPEYSCQNGFDNPCLSRHAQIFLLKGVLVVFPPSHAFPVNQPVIASFSLSLSIVARIPVGWPLTDRFVGNCRALAAS